MSFYARPSNLLSPGDIFPDLPVGTISHPLKIIRRADWNPPAARGPQDLWRAFRFPEEAEHIGGGAKIASQAGECVIASCRATQAMLLTWGSQIEEDLRNFERSGRAQGKVWLLAPVFRLEQIPENQYVQDRETEERIPMRQVIAENRSHQYMFLPSFPGINSAESHYVDFRKMTTLPIQYFIDAADSRLVALHEEGLNLLYSRIMWFLTRVEYFYHPIQCQKCGADVDIDLRFEGQNVNAEPWE